MNTHSDEIGQLFLRVHSLVTNYVASILRNRSYHGVSAEDIASDMVLSLWGRETGKRFIMDQPGGIVNNRLPPHLCNEARRRARQLLRKSATGTLDVEPATPHATTSNHVGGDGTVDRFVSALPPQRQLALHCRANGESKIGIACKLHVTARTLRNWWTGMRRDAIAAGIRP
jgi:DNA-directed RNA polymerase specialized sigma24 family protein